MRRRSLDVLFLVAVCASLPVAMVASCQGAPSLGGTTSSGSGGSGGSGGTTFSGLVGSSSGVAPEGGCADAAGDAGDDGPTGCEGIEGGVTYPEVAAIFSGCQGELCHGPPTYGTTVGMLTDECCDGRLLVDPGNAAKSYLFDKVQGVDLCSGVRMPLTGPVLSAAEMLTLRAWICEGAPGP